MFEFWNICCLEQWLWSQILNLTQPTYNFKYQTVFFEEKQLDTFLCCRTVHSRKQPATVSLKTTPHRSNMLIFSNNNDWFKHCDQLRKEKRITWQQIFPEVLLMHFSLWHLTCKIYCNSRWQCFMPWKVLPPTGLPVLCHYQDVLSHLARVSFKYTICIICKHLFMSLFI